jgi:hypothetical protein
LAFLLAATVLVTERFRRIVLLAVAAIAGVTGLARDCPLNAVIGLNTCRDAPRAAAGSRRRCADRR